MNKCLIELQTEIENYVDQLCNFQEWTDDERMKLYNLVHHSLTNPQNFFTKSSGNTTSGYDARYRSYMLAGNLYNHIESCLRKTLNNIYHSVHSMKDEDKIQLYAKHFYEHGSRCTLLNNACSRINEKWVLEKQRKGEQDVYTVNELAKQIWEETFLMPLLPCVKQVCLNLIKHYRSDKSTVDIESVKRTLGIYLKRGVNTWLNEISYEDLLNESTSNNHQRKFEIEFVRGTAEFYRQKTVPAIKSDSIVEYLFQVSEYFGFEIDFIQFLLPEPKFTLQILMDKLEEMFLPQSVLTIIIDQLKIIILSEDTHHEVLQRIHEVVSRIPSIKNEVVPLIENHICEEGTTTIAQNSDTLIKNPTKYVETIANIYKKYSYLDDYRPNFKTALDKACYKFINNNAVTQAPHTSRKSATLLVRFIDKVLRKENKTRDEMNREETFRQILIVFTYLEDKDIFEKFYSEMLATRLLEASSAYDHEDSLVLRFTKICNDEYTSRLRQMLLDIQMSTALINEYHQYCKHNCAKVLHSVMVLRSNLWPLSSLPNVVLPTELQAILRCFDDFYCRRHSSRKLIWLHQYSKSALKVNFTAKTYILEVSVYQMIVLLLFNDELSWTVEEIKEKTQVPYDLLIQVISSLLMNKIIFVKKIGENFQEHDIKMDHSIQLAEDFERERITISLNLPIKPSRQADLPSVNEAIDKDRKLAIQAVLVRIMKAKKSQKHSLLLQETIEKLSSFFKPNVSSVKECIELLIDKEYLKRDTDDTTLLHYIG